MTRTSNHPDQTNHSHAQAVALRRYGNVLRVYPPEFRQAFGEDMREVFMDLYIEDRYGGGGRGFWWRILRDATASGLKERFGSGGSATANWQAPALFVTIAAAIGLVVAGPESTSLLAALVSIIVLPTIGAVLLYRSARIYSTSARVSVGRITLGTATFVPTVVFLTMAGPDRGWYLVTAAGLLTCAAATIAIVWSISNIATNKRKRTKAIVVLALSALVPLAMIAAALNSYIASQPPPGDHTVENASPKSRQLWEAAWAGDPETVQTLIAACADPFVKFSGHGQVDYKASIIAEWQIGGWGNGEPVSQSGVPPVPRTLGLRGFGLMVLV